MQKSEGKIVSEIRPLVAGNWKMNGLRSALSELSAMVEGYGDDLKARVDLAICPPATLLQACAQAAGGSGLQIGGQDCHWNDAGAHTGDVSAPMLRDAGAGLAIVGHSERRADHGETSEMVLRKAQAAHRAGLIAVVCVGESEAERDSGQTLSIVAAQVAGSVPADAHARNTIIAYEPVWAIGTGRTPTNDDVAQVHAMIRDGLTKRFAAEGSAMRILYGGSVKPGNAGELMAVAHVNGALVGGASLKADDFLGIAAAYL